MAARRGYRLGKREEKTLTTRQRVVDEAVRQLRARHFDPLSLNELARTTKVGRTTLFEIFESKTGLLQAVENEVSRRAGVEALLAALSVDDGREALIAAFQQGALVWGAERLCFRRLFGQGAIDPALGKVMEAKQGGRRQLCRHLARQLHRQALLRPAVTEKEAAELLWLLTSFHAFDALADAGTPREVGVLQWRIAARMLLAE